LDATEKISVKVSAKNSYGLLSIVASISLPYLYILKEDLCGIWSFLLVKSVVYEPFSTFQVTLQAAKF
jgi:hypothetical protein